MAAEPKYHTCERCGMQFAFECEREIVCPGCNEWDDWGRDCSCRECSTQDQPAPPDAKHAK